LQNHHYKTNIGTLLTDVKHTLKTLSFQQKSIL
jgi:hypothetical protein